LRGITTTTEIIITRESNYGTAVKAFANHVVHYVCRDGGRFNHYVGREFV